MLLPSAYPFMVKQNGGISWVNDPRSHRMSSLKMSLWIMSTFVKWKFHERIFWTAHFQQLWAHGILSSLFLVKWVPDRWSHMIFIGPFTATNLQCFLNGQLKPPQTITGDANDMPKLTDIVMELEVQTASIETSAWNLQSLVMLYA